MADKWLTFDCYGTVADWNTGMGGALADEGVRVWAARTIAIASQLISHRWRGNGASVSVFCASVETNRKIALSESS